MGSQVDWFPALAFLAAGIAFGAVVVFWLRRARAAPVLTTAPLEVRDLLGRRDVLLRQLRELEDTASKRNPEQLARERYSLEIETAGVLRELDRRPGARAAAPAGAVEAAGATATGLLAGRPALRGFLWGVGGAGAVALLLFLVSQASRPRSEGAPATGDVPGARGAQAADAPAADGLDELRAAIARDPGDIDARMALVRAHLGRQDMMGVWNETQEILARSPDHPQALAYQALVRLAMGQGDMALDMLKRSLAKDPGQLDTYIHLSLVQWRLGHEKEADAALDDAQRRFPEQASVLAQVRQEIHRAPPLQEGEAADAHAAVSGPAPPPAGEPPAAVAPAETRAPSGPVGRVAGVVVLDPSLAGQVPPGTVVFVMVREAGFGAGPPIAAKRLVADSFPLSFELSDADSMRGDPLPPEVLLEARADPDGDPMTRSPEDPAARLDDVKVGATDVRLVLKRR